MYHPGPDFCLQDIPPDSVSEENSSSAYFLKFHPVHAEHWDY